MVQADDGFDVRSSRWIMLLGKLLSCSKVVGWLASYVSTRTEERLIVSLLSVHSAGNQDTYKYQLAKCSYSPHWPNPQTLAVVKSPPPSLHSSSSSDRAIVSLFLHQQETILEEAQPPVQDSLYVSRYPAQASYVDSRARAMFYAHLPPSDLLKLCRTSPKHLDTTEGLFEDLQEAQRAI